MPTMTRLVRGRLPKSFGMIAAVGLVVLFLASSFASAGGVIAGSPSAPIASHALTPHATSAAKAPMAKSSGVIAKFGPPPSSSSGRGTFFLNTPMPFSTASMTTTCATGYCVNDSNDPSVNYTSRGLIAVAYTDYTNHTSCANVSNWVQTQIGFSVSTNGGSTFSTPVYLGNKDCGHANQYANAWQPSLTSLANGTLVLAFVEFNLSSYTQPWSNYPPIFCGYYSFYATCRMTFGALAVMESYDNGTTWSGPVLLNATANPSLSRANWMPERPWATASGNTVYVAWMNYTESPLLNYSRFPTGGDGSAQSHLLVSTNGGSAWGSMINIPNQVKVTNLSLGVNPSLLVSPTGTLFLSYATNWNFTYQYPNGCSTSCRYDVWSADVVVGSSTNNGTTFTWTTAASGVFPETYRWSGQTDPSPEMAWSPSNGQLFVAWSSVQWELVCYTYGCYYNGYPQVYLTNSSNGGATWATYHELSHPLDSSNGFQIYNPAIAVDNRGILHVAVSYLNQTPSNCLYGYECPQWEVYLNSSDNGTTFGQAYVMWANATYTPYADDGEYATAVSFGNQIWFAWSHENCTLSVGSYCSFPYSGLPLTSQVTLSTLFQGTGYTLTYVENGIKNGTNWGISVLGNLRNGPAPVNLTVSGIPSGENLSWTVSPVAGGYGVQYASTQSVTPPYTFSGSTTVYENYSEQVLVNVTSNPNYPGCNPAYYYQYCWNYQYYPDLNYNITPLPAATWVPLNHQFWENVTPNPYFCLFGAFCYVQWINLTFQSWTGAGAGSVNSSAMNITFVAKGPVNETANFRVNGFCTYYSFYTPPLQCNNLAQTMTFHETGLPKGVAWNVTVDGATGAVETNSSASPWLTITGVATLGIVNYTVWTIPATGGLYWVGTGSPATPIELPADRVVNVTFTLMNPAFANFNVLFSQSGLPNGTSWTLNVGTSSWGVEEKNTTQTISGGSYAIGASDVYFPNGTGFYASSVEVQPFVENTSWQNFTSAPATVAFHGAAIVTIGFSPENRLTVTASAGGTATPASQWVHLGTSVNLNETPDANYSFVGWTGIGSGAVSSARPNPSVSPSGPVTEIATFVHNGPPTWQVGVQPIGLPNGITYSVMLGTQTYSSSGTISISGLLSGDYPISIPYAYENSSELTRFVGTVTSTSFTYSSPGVLHVTGSGTVNITFTTQYLVTVGETGPGSVSPAPGSYWVDAGTAFPISATPASHYQLLSWNGTGNGSFTGFGLSISPTANAPLWETAQFVWQPPVPPAEFTLTVSATGLPTGVVWNVSVGQTGASGPTGTLVVGGLNGTYSVGVATLYTAVGTRWVPDKASFSQPVTSNATASVAFTEQFLLTVVASVGGSVSAGTQWVNATGSVTITATANATSVFTGWNGTGAGMNNGTSATISVTLNNPITEVANFAPVYPTKQTGSATEGQGLALGILVVLIVVGLAVGLLLGRRRPPAAAPAYTPEPEPAAEPPSDIYSESPTDTESTAGASPDEGTQ